MLYIFIYPQLRATRHTNLIHFGLIIITISGEEKKIMKLRITQLSTLSRLSIAFRSKYSFQH